MSLERGPFKPGLIEPVVEVGQRVLLADGLKYRLYDVANIEPLLPSHPLIFNGGALAAAGVTAALSTTAVLDMEDSTFGQYRVMVLDDIHIQMRQPQAVTRWTNLNINATINLFTPLYDPCGHQTEFFLYRQERPFLVITNPTGYNLAQTRVAFWGYKYIIGGKHGVVHAADLEPIQMFDSIEQAMASGQKFTVVPTGGWRT